jgi:hypothetical protein
MTRSANLDVRNIEVSSPKWVGPFEMLAEQDPDGHPITSPRPEQAKIMV